MIMLDFSFPYSLNYKINKNLDLNLLDVEIGAIILKEENLARIEEI